MAKLNLRTPWTSQPQVPVGINWGNPLSRGLAFVAIGGHPVDLVRNKQGVYVGTASMGYGPQGRTFATVSGAANRVDFAGASPANSTGEFSFGSIFKADSDTGALQYLINRDAFANLFTLRSGPLYLQQTWNATGLFQSITPAVAGTWNIASSSSPPFGSSTALDAKLWLNGRKEAAGNATNGALGTTSIGDTVLNGRTTDNLRQLNGAQALAVSWNRVLTDAEHASWQANPWQLFVPLSRTIWVPVSAGGGTTYTMSPGGTITFSGTVAQRREHVQPGSGSITFSGTVAQRLTRAFSPSGSITFSGTVPLLRTRLQTTSGSIVFSGTAPFSQSNTYTLSPGGTITFSGTGDQIRERIQIPTGNILFSGTNVTQHIRTIVPSGSIDFSGSATETRIRILAPTGQIIFTGTAPLINPNAVGGVTTWRTLTGMGN